MTAGKQARGLVDHTDSCTRVERAAEKLASLSRLLTAGTSLVYRGGAFALLVLAAGAGFWFLRSLSMPAESRPNVRYADTLRLVSVREPIPWEKVDAAVAEAAARSRAKAEGYASGELETWNTQLMVRIDSDFLPWYFGYWNQQAIGLKTVWQGTKYELAGYITAGDTPSPSQQMTNDIQQEFANRVLHPESAQLFLEQLTRKTVDLYLADLRQELAQVQVTYKIPQPVWDRYLEDIAVTTQRIEGDRTVPLTLKTLAVSSVGAGAILTTNLTRMAGCLETRLSAATAEKAGAEVAVSLGEKMAAKTGGKVLAKAGGRFLGPVAAVAVIAWDVYDHHRTVSQNMPILRDSLTEYLGLLKESLLHDPQTGVAAALYEIDTAIVRSVSKDRPQTTLADAGGRKD